ncbi:MAG: hypothetical protein WBP45_00150 [Daejeonella sp.]
MIQFTFKQYTIEVYDIPTSSKSSANSLNDYNNLYFDEREYKWTSIHGIKVFQNNKPFKSAAITAGGGGTRIHKNSALIDNNRIVICCSDSVFCLTIPDLSLLWKTQADSATCFEILKYKESYIIHGEMEISRIDINGKILWEQSGADIFITPDGKGLLNLSEGFVSVKDWENRVYKYDYDGNDYTDKKQFLK